VQIAVYPWELELAAPETSTLTDTVPTVHQDRGGLLIKLTRFTIRTQSDKHDDPAIAEGANVGLRAAPFDVRVLAPGPRPTTVAPEGAPTAVAAIR
jgi:hypothetical protein